MSDFKAKMH